MPTGGVSLDNVNEYLANKKILACGGSFMVKESYIDNDKCISCFRCIQVCPMKAKGMQNPAYDEFCVGFNQKLAERKELMIAPTISYSPASYAVGDATSGTVHVEENAFEQYVYYVFMSMLSAGQRNIYVVIHHQ